MNFGLHPLVLVTFFPLVGILIILFLNAQHKAAIRWVALLTSLAVFAIAIWILTQFDISIPTLQMGINLPWVNLPNMPVRFEMGIDGISLFMVLLTAFLTPIAILSTWKAVEEGVKGFMIFFLLLEIGMVGVFLAADLVLFFAFWEFTLLPMIFLIGLWGGERRIYAALKFFLFTMVGSVLMLLAILFIGWQSGTFSVPSLISARQVFAPWQTWLFLAFAVAFAIKVPIFPLHTWLPDAHVEAPTAGSVILAGVLLKMGAYGFLRFNLPLFPEATLKFAPWFGALAVIGILYGAAVSYAQRDLKKLVAYSSVSHLGFVVLGIFALNAQGITGAVLQMVNHGLSTGALFLIVGFLYERRHTRDLAAFGGLWKSMPVLGTLALIITLSSMGLPGLNGFIGEFLSLLGAYGSNAYGSPWFAGFALGGVILAAVYLLTMFRKIFLGTLSKPENIKLGDLTSREILILIPILVMIFWIGLYPKPMLDLLNPSINHLVEILQSTALALR